MVPCGKRSARSPDRVFDAFIDPLRTRTAVGRKDRCRQRLYRTRSALKVVGKPDCENDPIPGSLHETLSAKYEQLIKEAETNLAVMAATFLEVPQFRLPGAEEAIRQMGERLKQQVDALEPLRADLEQGSSDDLTPGYFKQLATLARQLDLGASGSASQP